MNNFKKNRRIYFLVSSSVLFYFIFLIYLVSAVPSLGTFEQNKDINLIQVCDNCTFVNLTKIQLPDEGGVINIDDSMTKDGTYYNYTFIQTDKLGTYIYTTCGDDDGYLTCQSIDFLVTPSGSSGILGLFIVVIGVIYGVAFIGFFGRNEWVAVFGGLAMIILGLFTLNNGIDIFRNTITDVFSWTTIGLGSFFSLFTGVELIKENI